MRRWIFVAVDVRSGTRTNCQSFIGVCSVLFLFVPLISIPLRLKGRWRTRRVELTDIDTEGLLCCELEYEEAEALVVTVCNS